MNLQITPSQRQFADAHKARLGKFWPASCQPPIPDQQIKVAWALLNSDRFCTIRQVQDAACDYFKITRPILLGVRRGNELFLARRVTMYVCAKLTKQPYAEIGRRFGGRDHSTVIHNVRKAEAQVLANKPITKDVDALVAKLGGFQ